jgi:pimeloyl-ACP methyl ester carboxylesterase
MFESFRTLTVRDGTMISYRVERGEAPRQVIVLIHGMASNMTRWSEFVEQTALRRSWDLLRLDLRGNGRSISRGRISMETWCDDIASLLDAEGYSRAVLAGHCLGANIAVRFASRHPARAGGLILIEPLFPQAFTGVLGKVRPFITLLSPAIGFVRFLNRLGAYRRYFPHLDLRELDRKTRARMAESGAPEALTKRYASPCFDLRFMPATAYLQSLRELNRPLPSLAEIKAPMLLLFSTGKVFSDPGIARGLCKSLQYCSTEVIDSHHWIPTEKPAEMRAAIERWCAGLPALL